MEDVNDKEAEKYLREYFPRLFNKRDLSAIDEYLAKGYWDDDIGNHDDDHVRNSKEYLKKWFEDEPTIKIEIKRVIIEDEIITAYLHWYTDDGRKKETKIKGIGMFLIENGKIKKRHNYIYYRR